jgi:hypothetical protein
MIPEPTNPDATPPTAGLESDDRFPSGPWEGFFLQPMLTKDRVWMELILTFREGTVTGEGRDRVGKFVVRGRYTTDDGKCWFSKRYIGKHDVHYSGFNEGKGIWGVWELITPPWRGGFHVWPVGMADPTKLRTAAEADVPAEAQAIPVPAETEMVPAGAGVGDLF